MSTAGHAKHIQTSSILENSWHISEFFAQDQPVGSNLPLLQPEFTSKIDFAEGEDRPSVVNSRR